MRSFFFLSALLHVPAKAARPFVTDDARLTTAGSCQLESWTRFYADSTEVWALPACNPTGNLELTLGVGKRAMRILRCRAPKIMFCKPKRCFGHSKPMAGAGGSGRYGSSSRDQSQPKLAWQYLPLFPAFHVLFR